MSISTARVNSAGDVGVSPARVSGAEKFVRETFASADIHVGGGRPWDVAVHDDRFYRRVFGQSSLGLGESYMDGWWDCERLDLFFDKINRANLQDRRVTWGARFHFLWARLYNMQRISRAFQVGKWHYDRGNDLYQAMLGPRMVYSSCYYADGIADLAAAEEAKLDLICRKIGLERGQHVLDVGCGWGSFGQYAAEKYGARVTGITVSKEQVELGRERCAGLPVEFQLRDYRAADGRYDHVVSIGMVGHVGHKNYRSLMEVAHRCLRDGGLFFIHTMGGDRSKTAADPWIHKYIFPNGMAPSIQQLGAAMEDLFVMEDWHNFSTDYERTTMAWLGNFRSRWDDVKASYDERFYRMWSYYLCCFAGAFRSRSLETWDIVLSKQGTRGKYRSLR